MEFVLLILGAVFGVIFTAVYDSARRCAKRRNPLRVEVVRSRTPPMWFATNNLPPDDPEQGLAYENEVVDNAVFCGFAKINLIVTNKSNDVIYLTDIAISKTPIESELKYRVRTIPQGDSSALRLFACLDDERCFVSSSLSGRFEKNGNYFESGSRIKIAPGETDYIFLSFVALDQAWEFNCRLEYAINGKSRYIDRIFEDDLVLVPYLPEVFEVDFCSFLERVDPGYEKFADSIYFTKQMREVDPARCSTVVSSSLGYLEGEIG
ncbi:hypothetical protein [uncultured Adlercreutzia sp.]|uniref:hypothetical protein n=1 Tax=uncultured Adlercreutzia sp. TaxID=875803 RepID=UPI0025D60A63|nr:hypothetical protein [uncultured Adlercreutzia sp.]